MARASNEEIARLEAMHAENPRGRVFTHLAEAYRRAGDAPRARELLRRGLTDHPDYASAHVVMGRVLEDLGEATAAEQSFARVLELDPHNMIALRRLAVAADESGRREEALAHWSALASLEPGDEDVEERIAVLSAPAEEREVAEQGVAGATEDSGEAASQPASERRPADDPFEEELLRADEPLAQQDDDTGLALADDTRPELGVDGIALEGADTPALPDFPAAASGAMGEAEGADDLPLLDLPTTSLEFIAAGAGTSGDDTDLDDPGVEVVAGEDASPGEGWPALDPDLARADVPSDLAGVETETLGDLYAAQGLHARAAEVYRHLCERSPANLRLQGKLQEAEARIAAGEGEPVRPEWGDVAGAAASVATPPPAEEGEDPTGPVPAATDDLEGEVEPDTGAWEELEVPPEAVPPEPEPITFAEPHAYGAEDAVEVGAAWMDAGAVERDDLAGDGMPPLRPHAREPGTPWTGAEFEELFTSGPVDGEADHVGSSAGEPPAAETWAEEDLGPAPAPDALGPSISYGEADAASPLGGPELADAAEVAAEEGESYPAGPDASADSDVPEPIPASIGPEADAARPATLDLDPSFPSASDDDGSVGVAPDVPDALAAELAGALAEEDDGASSIRDLLRGVIGWEPAPGPATPEMPWSPEQEEPSVDPAPAAAEDPAPAASETATDERAPTLPTAPAAADQAPTRPTPAPEDAGRIASAPAAVERAPVAAPAPAPFDPETEPWGASPSSGEGGGQPAAPILELGEADRIRPQAAVSNEPQPGPSATPAPSAESPEPGTRGGDSAAGELGDLARSLLDASVEGDAGPSAVGDEGSDDEEVEVFRSWLRSLKK